MLWSRPAPDWPPAMSAIYFPEGTLRRGSTGQLHKVQNGQWVRVNAIESTFVDVAIVVCIVVVVLFGLQLLRGEI